MTDRELLERLFNEVMGMKSEMSSMKSEMSTMRSTLEEHTALLKALENRVEENTAQLVQVVQDVDYIKGNITGLQKNVAEIKEELTRHSDLLDVLAIRSTRQEAEIHSLKRAQ